jgi:predicted nucleic acid-binding protein
VLEAIVQDEDSFVSATVLGEIDVGRPLHRELDAVRRATWLTPVRIEGLAELTVFAEYVRILGPGPRNIGEAETLAWAETHDAVAVIDERAGARAANSGELLFMEPCGSSLARSVLPPSRGTRWLS